MTKIPHQEMGEARPLNEPKPLTRSEIDSRIRSLSDAGWNRLHRTAVRYAGNRNFGVDDLLQEAFRRAIDGSRLCPPDIDIVRFLCEAIRSIANGEQDKIDRKPPHLSLASPEVQQETDTATTTTSYSPEAFIRSEEDVSEIQDKMLALMEDEIAAEVLLGIMDGLSGEELCEFAGIDAGTLATKRRYIRRRIDKAFPKGWTE